VPPGAAGGRGNRLTVPILILAAGAGSRFGAAPKLLADLGGRPVLAHVVEAARGLGPITVVAGAHADEIRAAIEGVAVVECADWAEGQSASLRCGLAAIGDVDRALVLVGDQPGVTAAAIERLSREPPGSRAAYDGRPGHPVVLGRELIAAAARVEGDTGLRDVTDWRLVECGDVAEGADVDTMADLDALRRGPGEAGGR
jgi:CTP:molybdopterin cytidylyltransferase MocA